MLNEDFTPLTDAEVETALNCKWDMTFSNSDANTVRRALQTIQHERQQQRERYLQICSDISAVRKEWMARIATLGERTPAGTKQY